MTMMKAVAVRPGVPDSMFLAQLPKPSVTEIPEGGACSVKVLRVGVDGTDKEINAAEDGAVPAGTIFRDGTLGLGRVEAVGPNVTELTPGDYVVATVRCPGSRINDRIGTSDMTTDDVYYERGINLRHGYLTEYYVDDAEFIVKIPCELREVGVLLEPTTVVEKGIAQAYEIQRRLRVWRPRKAAVMGAGTIGLLATMALRLRGLDVTVFGCTGRPVSELRPDRGTGGRYESTVTLLVLRGRNTTVDLIFEATGASAVGVEHVGTGEERRPDPLERDRRGSVIQVPADRINLEFVRQGDGGDGQRQPGVPRDGRQGPGRMRRRSTRVGSSGVDPSGQGAGELAAASGHTHQREGAIKVYAKSHRAEGQAAIY